MKKKCMVLLTSLLLLTHCGTGDPGVMYPPVIGEITVSKTTAACNEMITMSIGTGMEEWNLRFFWLSTSGSMNDRYSRTVIWQAPAEKTGATIMVEVSDDTGSFKTIRSVFITVAPFTTSSGEVNDKRIGGGYSEKTYRNCLAKGPGGNLLFGLTTSSYDAAASDILLTAATGTGDILWQKTYGQNSWDSPGAIAALPEGGFIVWAAASDEEGKINLWVFKVDLSGNLILEKQYRLGDYDHITAAAVTKTGEYLAAGQSFSFDTFTWTPIAIKLDSRGSILWIKKYITGSTNDYITSINILEDGDILFSGYNSADGWLMKTGSRGDVLWQKSYNTNNEDSITSVQITDDRGFLVTGTMKITGSIKDNHQILLLKLDSQGNIMWNKTYGGAKSTMAEVLIETTDRGFLLGGTTDWFGQGAADWLLLKLNSTGEIIWQKTVGGSNDDILYNALALPGNGAFLGGYSRSFSDNSDGWIMNIDGGGDSIYKGQLTYMIPGSTTVILSEESVTAEEVLFNKDVLTLAPNTTVKTIKE